MIAVPDPPACPGAGVASRRGPTLSGPVRSWSVGSEAAAWADQQVAAVRHDPTGRITLMERCYNGPFGKAPRHLSFRRAAVSFMGWQLRRGVLQPPSDRPGSPWWRAA
jgi:hypothetical protein